MKITKNYTQNRRDAWNHKHASNCQRQIEKSIYVSNLLSEYSQNWTISDAFYCTFVRSFTSACMNCTKTQNTQDNSLTVELVLMGMVSKSKFLPNGMQFCICLLIDFVVVIAAISASRVCCAFRVFARKISIGGRVYVEKRVDLRGESVHN